MQFSKKIAFFTLNFPWLASNIFFSWTEANVVSLLFGCSFSAMEFSMDVNQSCLFLQNWSPDYFTESSVLLMSINHIYFTKLVLVLLQYTPVHYNLAISCCWSISPLLIWSTLFISLLIHLSERVITGWQTAPSRFSQILQGTNIKNITGKNVLACGFCLW